MRINNANAVSGTNILDDQIVEERRLAGSAFANRVEVMPPIVRVQRKWVLFTPSFTNT